MNHRLGTCSSCKAQYKVPASFQADRAKCKACGGVVAIGPVGGSAPAAAPKPEVKPAVKPAAAPATAAKPVPARPVPAITPKPAPKPVSEEKDSVRAAAEAAADRVRDAGRKTTAAETSAGDERKPGERERSKSGSRSKPKSGAGRHGARKEQSKAPMLAAVLVLMVAGGGAAWFLTRSDDGGSQAAEKGAEVAATGAENAPAEPEPAPLETASEPASEAPATPSEGVATGETAPQAAPATQPTVEDVDLTVFPDETKLPGTSDADWASLQEWTATFFDPNAGAAGNRARGKLFERGREAFPAVLNAMKHLDFSTDDGFRAGDLSQRFLMDVCNGQNFDWRYGTEPADVVFNKKVVRNWIKSWQQARDVPKAWAKLTKTTEEEALKLFAVTGPFDAAAGDGSSPDAPSTSSSLDDL